MRADVLMQHHVHGAACQRPTAFDGLHRPLIMLVDFGACADWSPSGIDRRDNCEGAMRTGLRGGLLSGSRRPAVHICHLDREGFARDSENHRGLTATGRSTVWRPERRRRSIRKVAGSGYRLTLAG
jgi:hypothetical protein